jgi:UDP-2-acetamido-3-amino-2,3-dideoxy-glucuronate N-acetyltransferase
MGYFKNETAMVETEHIGEGTRVWAYAHILAGARVGLQCNICDHTFLENDVVVGDRVTIKCGVQLWDGLRVADDVFIGPNATFTNDPFPRSGQHLEKYAQTVIRRGASIGANATVLPGITIGEFAMIGAGAVVTHDVPPHAKVVGNPARIVGYVDAAPESVPATIVPVLPDQEAARFGDVTVRHLPLVEDLRGSLSYGEMQRHVPFEVKRYFLVFDVTNENIRGEHAHRKLHQFLLCVAGRCHVVTDDGSQRYEFILDTPTKGLHIPPMIWATQFKFTRDAILLVFASDFYDAADYIRDYAEFRSLRDARL